MDSRTKFGRLLVPDVLAHDHGPDLDDDGGVGDHDDDSDDVDSGDDDDNSDDLVCEPPLPPSAQVLAKFAYASRIRIGPSGKPLGTWA